MSYGSMVVVMLHMKSLVMWFVSTQLNSQLSINSHLQIFMGVNHHGQSILLRCALISKEDCDTFELVFQECLRCMKGIPPKAILTYQAAAMRKPLENVMSNTRHRWFIWHILQKLLKKFAKDERYEAIKEDIIQVV